MVHQPAHLYLGQGRAKITPQIGGGARALQHKSRLEYDAYRKEFGFDDAQAIVVVEAPDVFTNEGLDRVRAIEDEFRAMPEVAGVPNLGVSRSAPLMSPLMPDTSAHEVRVLP